MQIAMTTNERHPEQIIEAAGGQIVGRGTVGECDWARYRRGNVDAISVWRTVQIGPDGYDYQMVTGGMKQVGNLFGHYDDLGEWQRNMADWDIVQRARFAAMTDYEREIDVETSR